MYFAILWKNPEISLAELELVKPTIAKTINNQIVVFETQYPEKLDTLWWIIKRGETVNRDELKSKLLETKLIWVSNGNFWLQLKRNYGIRRYKTVDIFHTDLEIKKKWLEVIDIQNLTWIVKWYQNINLYEVVDFDKPARSMQMWMMPAKLTLIMINLWLQQLSTDWEANIYDPFAWSMTTWFIANFMWHSFIGSDIEWKYADENLDRRKHNKFYNSDKNIDFFQHDINNNLTLDKFKQWIPNLIVTEWRLWPIVRRNEGSIALKNIQEETYNLYETFIRQIYKFYKTNTNIIPTMVFTIPIYREDNIIEENIKKLCNELNFRKLDSVDEIYKRAEQNIWRKILVLKQN